MIFPIDYIDGNQKKAVDLLRSGSILVGGVGSGKSRTALSFWLKEYSDRHLYIITTPHKRDTKDWSKEALHAFVSLEHFTVDSWNNIHKYIGVKDAFFIFDEQRLVGKGAWSKSFLKIAKGNKWIVLTATPGDTWMDYATIFIANGFFKNRTEFCNKHVVYDRVARYPKVKGYIDTMQLVLFRERITVKLNVQRKTVRHSEIMWCDYNREKYIQTVRNRWNDEKEEPYLDGSALCYGLRKIVGDSNIRPLIAYDIMRKRERLIIFYNFDYELKALKKVFGTFVAGEWNGHRHDPVPDETYDWWVYLVQYNAGAEAWECINCDTILFYSANYSYKMMEQAAGRIDRRNTPFKDLYYYCIATQGTIETKILSCLHKKRNFNEKTFVTDL